MRNRIKVTLKIRIIDGLIARLQMRPYFLQGIMRRPFAAEPIAAVQKVRLEYRLQYQERSHLGYTIPYRRDPQWAQFPILFLDPHSTHRPRLVGFLLQ